MLKIKINEKWSTTRKKLIINTNDWLQVCFFLDCQKTIIVVYRAGCPARLFRFDINDKICEALIIVAF